jgi:hypothetical protein
VPDGSIPGKSESWRGCYETLRGIFDDLLSVSGCLRRVSERLRVCSGELRACPRRCALFQGVAQPFNCEISRNNGAFAV